MISAQNSPSPKAGPAATKIGSINAATAAFIPRFTKDCSLHECAGLAENILSRCGKGMTELDLPHPSAANSGAAVTGLSFPDKTIKRYHLRCDDAVHDQIGDANACHIPSLKR